MRARPLLAFVAALLCAAAVPLPVRASTNNDAACAALNFTSPLTAVSKAAVPPNVCASVWATELPEARGLLSLAAHGGDESVLVVLRPSGGSSTGSIVWLHDADGSGSIDRAEERKTLATAAGINHGIALWRPSTCTADNCLFLLASSIDTVYAWPFDLANPSAPLGSPTTLVSGLPSGGHNTRTLEMDPAAGEWLYVSVGSNGNIDTSHNRSLIWRFNLASWTPGSAALVYGTDGELFAGGLRNEVALAWDSRGELWGAENGADRLEREDIGGDIHNDNPGEEINKFSSGGATGQFYGYPYCWSEYNLPGFGQGKGTQWAWPDSMNDGVHGDAWCRNTSNVVPPVAVIPAHTAPLGMKFVTLRNDSDAVYAFPTQADAGVQQSFLVVAQHGSWNRAPAQGYRVVRFPVADAGGAAGVQVTAQDEEAIFQFDDATAQTGSGWGRPVDVAVGKQGELFVSDDELGRVVVLRYVREVNQTDEPLTPGSSTGGDVGGATVAAMTSSWAMGILAAVALLAVLKQ